MGKAWKSLKEMAWEINHQCPSGMSDRSAGNWTHILSMYHTSCESFLFPFAFHLETHQSWNIF